MKTTMTGMLLALTLTIPAVAASQERVGVATTVVGPVTIARVATPPAPLKFKDDVFLNDRVVTGEKGFARMLLGGKAIVTAREHSVITINEMPGVSTVDLISGRIAVAVDKARMKPGEIVEIRTPNAVAGIRGTIVVAEALGGASTITVLRGLVDVYRRDPASGNAFGPATPVSVRESVTVKANVLPARPQVISVDNAGRLSNDFTAPVRVVPPANTTDEYARAQNVISALTGKSGRRDVSPGRLDASGAEGIGSRGAPTQFGTVLTLPTATVPVVGGSLPTLVSTTPVVTTAPSAVTQPVALKDLLKLK
ncbi:MAG TPA: FecR domain-containing protein [Methylomirabilota bacterium]|jgi:hypothetical protein|nr:FecR domain-containing protein [Methylomirabilota bacterium]